jgi:organic hydroperoxide reductase OsmC/OhrA
MSQFPHEYDVSAKAAPTGLVVLAANGVPELESAPPRQFGGPGDQWSPEDLLVAAVADCFVLSFRAIATASKFEWTSVRCEVTGTLDKVERSIEFTAFTVRAHLTIPASSDQSRGQRLLEKAEQACLVTNSLKAKPHLETTIETISG